MQRNKKGQFVKTDPKKRFWRQVEKKESCWEWKGKVSRPDGYPTFWNGEKWVRGHRYSWYLHTGSHPKLHVCHKCDNKICVRPGHLYEGTQKQNMKDMVDRKRNAFFLPGIEHPKAMFNKQQVCQIRELHSKGFTSYKIAEIMNCSQQTAHRVATKKRYENINCYTDN